jgi:hypothetical protein
MTELISGGAPGPDRIAEEVAKGRGIKTTIFPAEWDKLGKQAGFLRNAIIIKEASFVVAFWDGKSRGTLDTIKKAVSAGKQVHVYGPPNE